MGKETFRIRIRRDGTVVFQSREIGHERMVLLREMLEDCIGEITEVRRATDADGPPPETAMTEAEKQRERLEHGE